MAKKFLGLVVTTLLVATQAIFAAPATSGGLVKAAGGEALPVVSGGERSKHFGAVAQQLELGGTLFAYADIDGDPQRIAEILKTITKSMGEQDPKMAMLQQDFTAIFAELGLSDVKAVGLSSVHAGGDIFRNRVFLYTPEGRHGLLAGLGGPAAPFKHLKLAPANADAYVEGELDLPAVYSSLLSIVTKVAGTAGANAIEANLRTAGNEAGISALGIIQSLKGHVAAVVRIDANSPWEIPGRTPVSIPQISLLLRIDGVGAQLAPLLEQFGSGEGPFARSDVEGRKIFEFKGALPLENLKPVIVLEGNDLMIATTRSFFDSCTATANRLGETKEFRTALAALGTEGNGLFYVTPRLVKELRRLPELNRNAPPDVLRPLEFGLMQLPELPFPIAGIRVNRPDGVLFVSTLNRSLKADVAALAVYNPVTVGLMAAMAIPAFNKVRSNSTEKVIQNNLRMFQAAGDQYCLENNVSSVTYEQIVGPGKLLEQLEPVAGEDYTELVYKPNEPLSVTTSAGKTISLGTDEESPPANP